MCTVFPKPQARRPLTATVIHFSCILISVAYDQNSSIPQGEIINCMTEYILKFSSSTVADTGAFKLLELPSDLGKLIEESPGNLPRQVHQSTVSYSILLTGS